MWHVGSLVVVHGLSSSAACGVLVLRPGIKHTVSVLEGGFLTTGPPAKSLGFFFFNGLDFSRPNWELATHRTLFTHRHQGDIGWELDEEGEKQGPDFQISVLTEKTVKHPSSLPSKLRISCKDLEISTCFKQ